MENAESETPTYESEAPINDQTGWEEDLTIRRRCTAMRSNGIERCKRTAILGGTVCFTHGGAAPQVQRKARERLLELVEPALTELTKIVINKNTSENVRLSAIKDILDRSGLAATIKVEQDVHVFDTREEILSEAEQLLNQIKERADGNT